jgi:hypothetical protein
VPPAPLASSSCPTAAENPIRPRGRFNDRRGGERAARMLLNLDSSVMDSRIDAHRHPGAGVLLAYHLVASVSDHSTHPGAAEVT